MTTPTIFVLDEVSDGAPAQVKKAIRVRNQTPLCGRCPECGAECALPNRAERRQAARTGRVLPVRVEHDDDCIAISADAVAWLRGAG